ncbi:MAG TPA: orotate phosphoribosyltransferase [Gammaproteobacteria bacterium]|nr:orotate phosphoribosyltransferase [Gammaproteobacteria bacterium]
MQDYKKAFLEFAIETGVLRFGSFTLKSGRVSPYFFNTGIFNTGKGLARLGQYYAQAIIDSGIEFDMIFGPAYKGIPLAAATAIALAEHHDCDVPWSFDRKEAKDHGEGGMIVGAPLSGRVLIIDDVISAGLSVGYSIDLIDQHSATPAGIIIALDRQERASDSKQSALQQVHERHGIPVLCIASLTDLVELLDADSGQVETLAAIQSYRDQYGA